MDSSPPFKSRIIDSVMLLGLTVWLVFAVFKRDWDQAQIPMLLVIAWRLSDCLFLLKKIRTNTRNITNRVPR